MGVLLPHRSVGWDRSCGSQHPTHLWGRGLYGAALGGSQNPTHLWGRIWGLYGAALGGLSPHKSMGQRVSMGQHLGVLAATNLWGRIWGLYGAVGGLYGAALGGFLLPSHPPSLPSSPHRLILQTSPPFPAQAPPLPLTPSHHKPPPFLISFPGPASGPSPAPSCPALRCSPRPAPPRHGRGCCCCGRGAARCGRRCAGRGRRCCCGSRPSLTADSTSLPCLPPGSLLRCTSVSGRGSLPVLGVKRLAVGVGANGCFGIVTLPVWGSVTSGWSL